MTNFKIDHLDHVAINVSNMAESIAWYEKVFGLKTYKVAEWGEYPVFLLAGKTGIALFPVNRRVGSINQKSEEKGIDHFAFNVTNENYAKAKLHFDSLGIDYIEKDHHYFHSVYTKDPDGHEVELTTLVVDEDSFYKL